MTTSPEKMAEIVAALQKSRSYQRGAWLLVTEAARKYAQMKAHGSYMENGNCITVCATDRENYTEMFKGNLLRAVEKAYAEDAIMGAALADAT
jgi:hypothetical protein